MSEFKELKLSDIFPSRTNPRSEFEENSIRELSESIKQHGVLQPIIVREQVDRDNKYDLVCGERRYRASIIAELDTIPASIRELSDDEVFEIQITENLERKDVHPMDEARAFKKMIDSGKYTIEDIAAKVAKTETFIAQRLKLNDLIPELKEDFLKGEFGVGHAVLLSRVSVESQEEAYNDSKNSYNDGYGTIKELKRQLENDSNDLDKAIFDTEDPNLYEAPPCSLCPKCSKANTVLFPEYEENLCFDSTCYSEKEANHIYSTVENVIKENPGIIFVDNYYNSKSKIVESLLKENNKTVLTGYSEFSEDDTGNTVAFHLDKLHYVNIILKEGAKSKNVSSDPNENIKTEIANLKAKAERALELDREKIMQRINAEIIENENNILIENDYFVEDEVSAFIMTLYEKGSWEFRKWIEERFEIKISSTWSSTEFYDFIKIFRFEQNTHFEIYRAFVMKNLPSNSTLDFGKSCSAKALYDYVNYSYPKEIELFTIEQNDVAAKRIAKSDARIAELKKSLNVTPIENNPIGPIKDITGVENFKYSKEAIQEVTDIELPTFEKITRKKKFALTNSYFKNLNPQTEPRTPFEVYAYYKQHGELPFDSNPDTDPNWLYETYIEYQKRAGVYNSQFFTPPFTADRIAELADEYFRTDERETCRVLDACCGFGMLTKPLTEKGFIVNGFDNNSEILKMYSEYTGCISEQKDIHSYLAEDTQWMNIVSNPPYEIKELTQFLKLLWDLLKHGGLAVLLLPKGFVDKDKPKALVEVLEKFSVMHREDMQEDFARTGMKAEIVVLEKN